MVTDLASYGYQDVQVGNITMALRTQTLLPVTLLPMALLSLAILTMASITALLWQVGKYCAFNTYLPHFDIDGVCVHKYPWKLLASQGQNHTVP